VETRYGVVIHEMQRDFKPHTIFFLAIGGKDIVEKIKDKR
jgi:hypothetical protein